jgi:NADPH:quinone reductase-like Zn-dependent oxidoreductase
VPRAYVFTEYGGPETQRFVDLPKPVPGAGELLIRVRAAGVNPVDWKIRAGYMRAVREIDLPAVLGVEAAGVVEQVGEGMDDFSAGDEVFGQPASSSGGYAEYALLTELTAKKPAGVSFADAATLAIAAATAYDGVHQLGLEPGSTLLINGVGGGVGVAAAQIAKGLGWTVLGTASAAKRDFVESLGVVHVASGDGVAERSRAAAPGGVDAIFDLVGGEALEAVASLATNPAKVISAADATTAAAVGGSFIQRARTREVLDAVAALVEAGSLDPHVTNVLPLDRAGEALSIVEGGHSRGKVVLEIS